MPIRRFQLTLLRRVFASLAAAGLLGASAQASAIVRLERDALESRVQAVRDALDDTGGAGQAPPAQLTAQWNNWKNWNNWINWKNWGNWGNK